MIMALPILLLLVLAIGGVVLILRARGKRNPLTGPVCGDCRYSVVGLTNMICPECGGDLRRVGILTPHSPRRTGRAIGAVIAFTITIFFVALVSSVGVAELLPLRHSDFEQMRLTTPHSGAYREIVLHAGAASYLPDESGLPVEIDLTANPAAGAQAAPSWLVVHPDGSYEYVANGSPRIARPNGFGKAAVIEWLKASGIDVSAPSIADEAAEISGQLHLMHRKTRRTLASPLPVGGSSISSGGGSGAFASFSMTQRGSAEPPDWAPLVLLLIWLALWVCGLRYLIKSYRVDIGRQTPDHA